MTPAGKGVSLDTFFHLRHTLFNHLADMSYINCVIVGEISQIILQLSVYEVPFIEVLSRFMITFMAG